MGWDFISFSGYPHFFTTLFDENQCPVYIL